MTSRVRFLLAACALAAPPAGVVGFAVPPSLGAASSAGKAAAAAVGPLYASPSSPSSSRRDVLSNAASLALLGVATLASDPEGAAALSPAITGMPVTEASAANMRAYASSYQGVYSDPNHPGGYRVIMADGRGGATMTLCDGDGEETYKNVPVGVKDGELSFDFGFKGGPKGVPGVLSDDRKYITFPDGNKWTKNANEYDGIYKDPKYPKGYRIVRKYKSTRTITEVNDTGNPADSKFVMGEHSSLFSIPTAAFTFYDFPGVEKAVEEKPQDILSYAMQAPGSKGEHAGETVLVGQFSLQDRNTVFPYGTITFPDKTVWTRI